ncbi:unnamed protein product, partial [marine sediment metagenome]
LLQMLRERDVKVIVVNKELPKNKLKRMGFESVPTIEAAIDLAQNWHQEADVAVLPAGAETMTRIRSS